MAEPSKGNKKIEWKWESAIAGGVAGFSNTALTHPFDVIRTRFQVNDGRISYLPKYKNTANALFTIARSEGLRGLYAGFPTTVFGGTVAWGLYFFIYTGIKEKKLRNSDSSSSYAQASALHLSSAAEAGALVCLVTNPIFLVKTRLQLQTPHSDLRRYSGFYDAVRTIMREEGWRALYRGLVPNLILVGHGSIQFTVYEMLRKSISEHRGGEKSSTSKDNLKLFDFAVLGASSKVAAFIFTYPFMVIRSRLQQCPSIEGAPQYASSWGVLRETVRFEGVRGLYKGVTPHLLKNVPASAVFFVVYENLVKHLAIGRRS